MSTKQANSNSNLKTTFLTIPEMKILARHLTELSLLPDDGKNPALEMLVASTRLEARGVLRVVGVKNGLSVLDLAERAQQKLNRTCSQRTERNQ